MSVIKELNKEANISCVDKSFPFPPDLDDQPLRNHIGDYPSISVRKGIEDTYKAFESLKIEGKCPSLSE